MEIIANTIERTLCASCRTMWDGFGLPCPSAELHKTKCTNYDRMSDDELLHFAPQFWNETFVHHVLTDDEAEQLHTDCLFMWQPIRPLLSEITPTQLSLFD